MGVLSVVILAGITVFALSGSGILEFANCAAIQESESEIVKLEPAAEPSSSDSDSAAAADGDDDDELVVPGPAQIIRHPVYNHEIFQIVSYQTPAEIKGYSGEENGTFSIVPPDGYGLIAVVQSIDLRTECTDSANGTTDCSEKCRDYIQISTDSTQWNQTCGFSQLSPNGTFGGGFEDKWNGGKVAPRQISFVTAINESLHVKVFQAVREYEIFAKEEPVYQIIVTPYLGCKSYGEKIDIDSNSRNDGLGLSPCPSSSLPVYDADLQNDAALYCIGTSLTCDGFVNCPIDLPGQAAAASSASPPFGTDSEEDSFTCELVDAIMREDKKIQDERESGGNRNYDVKVLALGNAPTLLDSSSSSEGDDSDSDERYANNVNSSSLDSPAGASAGDDDDYMNPDTSVRKNFISYTPDPANTNGRDPTRFLTTTASIFLGVMLALAAFLWKKEGIESFLYECLLTRNRVRFPGVGIVGEDCSPVARPGTPEEHRLTFDSSEEEEEEDDEIPRDCIYCECSKKHPGGKFAVPRRCPAGQSEEETNEEGKGKGDEWA